MATISPLPVKPATTDWVTETAADWQSLGVPPEVVREQAAEFGLPFVALVATALEQAMVASESARLILEASRR